MGLQPMLGWDGPLALWKDVRFADFVGCFVIVAQKIFENCYMFGNLLRRIRLRLFDPVGWGRRACRCQSGDWRSRDRQSPDWLKTATHTDIVPFANKKGFWQPVNLYIYITFDNNNFRIEGQRPVSFQPGLQGQVWSWINKIRAESPFHLSPWWWNGLSALSKMWGSSVHGPSAHAGLRRAFSPLKGCPLCGLCGLFCYRGPENFWELLYVWESFTTDTVKAFRPGGVGASSL